MIKIALISGDNHLRLHTWAKHPELAGDAFYSLTQLVDACVHQSLPLILLGDMYDQDRPDSASVTAFTTEMNRMEHARLSVYFIQGNHDKADPPWCSAHPWPCHVNEQMFEVNGVEFYGLDYCPSDKLGEKLAVIPPDAEILLSHQSWSEVQPIGHTDGSLSQLPRELTVFSGDFHVTKQYAGVAANGDPVTLYSPGSTSMQAIDEPPHKYFYILEVDEAKDQFIAKRVQLATRGYTEFTVTTEEAFAECLRKLALPVDQRHDLPPHIAKPMLRATYYDMIPEAYTRLIAALGDKFHLFHQPRNLGNEETVEVDMVNTPEGAFDNLLTAVGELVPTDSPVYHGVQRLLAAPDPLAEITNMFEEYKANYARPQHGEDPSGVSAG